MHDGDAPTPPTRAVPPSAAGVGAPVVRVGDAGGGVRRITLNRPDRLNACTMESYRALDDALRAAADDEAVRVVLLDGAGRAFCSGVDLDAFAALDGDTVAIAAAFTGLLDALTTFPKPIVAAVQGAAVGFGATMLLHADTVLMADDARLRFPFTAIGTVPEAGSSFTLPAIVGPLVAADLVLTARWMPASEAVDVGLASRALPADALAGAALDRAQAIAVHDPALVQASKRLLRAGWADASAAAIAREATAAGAFELRTHSDR